MAKPKRAQRRPGATASHRSPAKRTGTSSANGMDQGPMQKAGANANRDVAKATSSGAGMVRSSSPVAARATGAAGSVALRQRVQARGNQRRYQRKRTWWSRAMPILLPVVGVLLVVGIFIAIAHNQSGSVGSAHSGPRSHGLACCGASERSQLRCGGCGNVQPQPFYGTAQQERHRPPSREW